MTSSGTPDRWVPAAWPVDARASALLQEWLTDPGHTLNLVDADLRGADLSGAEFLSSYWNNADLRGVRMREIDLYRASLADARLDCADLTGASLIRANLDGVSLRDAVVDRSTLGRVSMMSVDAQGASFRHSDFAGSIVRADARGADFRAAVLSDASLRIRVDEATRFEGMRGRFLGPFVLVADGTERELDGDDLRQWLASRGADVEIMVPKHPHRR